MPSTANALPLSPDALTASLKGSPRGYLAEFIQHRELIRQYLAQGHNLRGIHDHLHAVGAISFSYATLRRLVRKHMLDHREALLPATPHTPSHAAASLAAHNRQPQPTQATARSLAQRDTATHHTNPLLERRERPAFNYEPSENTKNLY